jgi:RecB family exonuclease
MSLRHHLERMVTAFLALEARERDDYTIVDVEVRLGFSFEGWEFTGRMDRVDRMPDGTLALLDYKAGRLDKMARTMRKKILTAGQRPDTANWQVPLYVTAYRITQGVTPRVFKHHVLRPGDDGFSVRLLIRDSEEGISIEEASGRREHQGISYLLCDEVERVMRDAVALAARIFAVRSRFEKTENRKHCRSCTFRSLCGREER